MEETMPTAEDDFKLDDELEPERDPVEAIAPMEPRMQPVIRHLGRDSKGEAIFTFRQQEMSFLSKWEFFRLVAKALKALADAQGEGFSLGLLMGALGLAEGVKMEDAMRADVIIGGFMRLCEHMPELLDDSICIWLNVDPPMREHCKYLMRKPASEGGFSDDEGFDIVHVAIEQNMESFSRFFRKHLPELGATVQSMAARAGKPSSTPSKGSAQNGASR